jgi:serine phosphatase RsbU (regulator of sigma subunit)
MQSNDFIVVYSDCIVEMQNSYGNSLGLNGLLDIIKDLSQPVDAQVILKMIVESFYIYVETNQNLSDDLTILVLRKK